MTTECLLTLRAQQDETCPAEEPPPAFKSSAFGFGTGSAFLYVLLPVTMRRQCKSLHFYLGGGGGGDKNMGSLGCPEHTEVCADQKRIGHLPGQGRPGLHAL